MKDISKLKVSVIMPAYNAARFIQNAINSVQTQSHMNFEVIIINDGSMDDTEEVVRTISEKDDRLYLFSQSNKGVSSARNLGLSKMTGDFFCFLDADDFMTANSLESRLKEFVVDDKLWFVDGSVQIVDMESQNILRTYVPSFKGAPLKDLLLLSGVCFCGQTWLIKRDENFKYRFNEQLTHGEDLSFFIELSKHYSTYSFTNDVILKYNQHRNSAMGNLKGLGEFYLYHLKECKNFCKNQLISTKEYKQVKSRIRRIMTRSYLKKGKILKAVKWI